MNVVAAAVDSVVPKLLQLLQDEYKLQRNVKKSVESLSKELKAAHIFLCKVSEVPWYELDEQTKEWASEIREASYNMEDILDTFLVRVEGHESTGQNRLKLAMSKFNNVFGKVKARHDVGSAIENIMKDLEKVAAQHARYRIDDLPGRSAATMSTTTDPRLAAMYKEVTSLVGIEKPSKDLIAKLSAPHKKRIVVSIFGIGGLGKTTVAKSVYDKLRPHFTLGAFIPVGRNPNLKKVLMDILYELDKNAFEDINNRNWDERQLIDKLQYFLRDKRLPELCYLHLETRSTITSKISVGKGYFEKLRFCHMPKSMIQFHCEVRDSSVSIHVWNGINVVPFSCSKKDCTSTPYAVMPNLEVLECEIFVRALKDNNVECDNIIGLECLPSLHSVNIGIYCAGASAEEVYEVEVALREATKVHSNCPVLDTWRFDEHIMILPVQDQKPEENDAPAEEEVQNLQTVDLTGDEDVIQPA